MKQQKFLKKTLAYMLTLCMLLGLFPAQVFASHRQSDGFPLDLANEVILSLNTNNTFPGEPNTHTNTANYVSFNSSFSESNNGYSSSASTVLDNTNNKLFNALEQGPTIFNRYYVWGLFDTGTGATSDGLAQYFVNGSSNPIFNDENETKMIAAARNISTEDAANYEIVWYVIKYQTSDTAWHIDGIIRPRNTYSVNYYGNGNTSGGAPAGAVGLAANTSYTVLGNTDNLRRVVAGVEYIFDGWNTAQDGSGTAYNAGDIVTMNEDTVGTDRVLALYAQWESETKYKATARLYLDGVLTNLEDIHPSTVLYISKDTNEYLTMSNDSTGVYSAEVTESGTYHLYHIHSGETEYETLQTYNIPIYNANGSVDVHHYSVNYHSNGGALVQDDDSYKSIHFVNSNVDVIGEVPVQEGYIFTGWNTAEDGTGTTYQPGNTISGLSVKTDLYAQWEETVDVYINVTLNHGEAPDHNTADLKDSITIDLVSRKEGTNDPYLEVEGGRLELSCESHNNFIHYADGVNDPDHNIEDTLISRYDADGPTFTGLPASHEYSIAAISKPNYIRNDTLTTVEENSNGDWVINIVMDFSPDTFNLELSVEMEDTVPENLYPDAVIAKIVRYDTEWHLIKRHSETAPGIRIDIDPEAGTGNATFSVWQHEEGASDPYGYRFVITAFVYDDSIVPVKDLVLTADSFTDGVYTAALEEINGQMFGGYDAAYGETQALGTPSVVQRGTLHALISMELYDVTFDANGGTVEGSQTYTLQDQYRIPDFRNYTITPPAEKYIFDGWYMDAECTQEAEIGKIIEEDITIYAKWKEPLRITGTVEIAGTYELNGNSIEINDSDRAKNAMVLLEEVGVMGEIDDYELTFDYLESDSASATYEFVVADDGKNYEIIVRVNNYTATYDNEPIDDSYAADNNAVVFGNDSEGVVNAKLAFTPDSYNQQFIVDADAIGENFRPDSVEAVLRYRDLIDNHIPKVISNHLGGGITLELNEDIDKDNTYAEGQGQETIWKYHYNAQRYEYLLGITEVYGDVADVYNADGSYDTETAPYYLEFSDSTTWGIYANEPIGGHENSGILKATFVPKDYNITFDTNAGSDMVTGMESITDNKMIHTWSYETDISSVVPARIGYTFVGWFEDLDDDNIKDDNESIVTSISAAIHRDVELTAQWTINQRTVTYTDGVDDEEIFADQTSTVNYGETTPAFSGTPTRTGHTFNGWSPVVAPTVTANVTYVAQWTINQHTVTYTDGVDGEVIFPDQTSTVNYGETTPAFSGTPTRTGHTFNGWSPVVAPTVTANVTYVAQWTINQHAVTYTDGVDGEEIFADQTTTVNYGDTTPAFSGTTTRAGYTFNGWSPVVAPTVTANVTYVAQWTINQHTVTYTDGVDGEVIFPDQTSTVNYGEATPAFSGTTTRAGYTFVGWSPEVAPTVTANATYTAQWAYSGGGGSGGARYYNLTYETNGGDKINRESHISGKVVELTKVPKKEGYVFEGWYIDEALTENVTEVKMTKNITVYAAWVEDNGSAGNGHGTPDMLNGEDHFAYVVGYPDGTVRPNDNINRAEVTAIFFRLLKPDEVRDQNLTSQNNFNDVNEGEWYNTPISTMTKLGIVNGRRENTFAPEAMITRAEFAAICARFDDSEYEVLDNFTDVAGHWAETEIHEAAAHGWIRGYNDGTFKPDQFITRAEAMTMINRVLNRVPETSDDLLDDMIKWPDNSDKSAWYYLAVQEATNSHDYVMKNHIYEKWVSIREATDWTKYE